MKTREKTGTYVSPIVKAIQFKMRGVILSASTFSGTTTGIDDDYQGFSGDTSGLDEATSGME